MVRIMAVRPLAKLEDSQTLRVNLFLSESYLMLD